MEVVQELGLWEWDFLNLRFVFRARFVEAEKRSGRWGLAVVFGMLQ